MPRLPRLLPLFALAATGCPLPWSAAADEAPYPHAVTFTASPELRPFDLCAPADRVPALRELPADAPPIRKVRRAQAEAGLLYLARIVEVIRCGAWRDDFLPDALAMADEAYRAAAEAEEVPADRLRWCEERVRLLKSLERFVEERVQIGRESPERWHLARFCRYAAEADILRLREEARKAGAKPRPLATLDVGEFLKAGPPEYTAFPDVKPPPPGTDSRPTLPEEKDARWAGLPEPDADATPLRKVLFARAVAALSYRHRITESVRAGWSNYGGEYIQNFAGVLPPSLAVADLEDLANRTPGYERALALMKSYERMARIRVKIGVFPPWASDLLSFRRLEAEAELLRLRGEVARCGAKPTPPGKRKVFDLGKGPDGASPPEVSFTAFPKLKSPGWEPREPPGPDGRRPRALVEKDAVALPPAPELPAGAPPLRRVLVEQAREGLAYVASVRHLIGEGEWSWAHLPEYARMTSNALRLAAELEGGPAERLAWNEARVRSLKGVERLAELGSKSGRMPPRNRDFAAVLRLGAEADLLRLWAGGKGGGR